MSREIKCPCGCGKIIAKKRDKDVYVWCKKCKKEVKLEIKNSNA
jgi:hypothetical protein